MDPRQHLRADYTCGPLLQWWLRTLYRLASFAFGQVCEHRIERIVGLENLPPRGPFMIVANHLSYMDDFLLAHAVRQYCGEKLYIPTNKKAFRGRFKSWLHLAGGAVEIDPADRQQSYDAVRRLAADGKIVLMFPEGTRSDGDALLPFRFGAFNLAHELGLTIVPVALVDTHRVLPRHRLWPVRGAKASAAFLAPIPPAAFKAAGGDVAAVKADCRDRIADALHGTRRWADPPAAQATAAHLARRVEESLEALIERGPETIRAADLAPAARWQRLSRHVVADDYAMQVQAFRAFGFRLLAAPRLLAPVLLPGFRRRGAAARARDPHQPFVHYVHGQFNLRAPWIVGARRRVAVVVLDQAWRRARRYGLERERFAVSYAQALAKVGRTERARRVLELDFTSARCESERLRRRAERAQQLLASLNRSPTAPRHATAVKAAAAPSLPIPVRDR